MLTFLNNLLLISDLCKPLKHSLTCNPRPSRNLLKNNINTCADNLFNATGNFLAEHVEPIQLPDFSSSFNYTLLLTYYGHVNLTGGSLQNISSFKRAGDYSYSKTSTKSEITMPLIFDTLVFKYNYSAALFGSGPTGTISGLMKGLKMEIVLGYEYLKSEISLNFRATGLKYFDLEFDGHDYIDWFFNLLSDLLIILLRGHILTGLEEGLRDACQKYIAHLNTVILDYQSTIIPVFLEELLQAADRA